jgi:hypothetical protein
MEDNTYNSIDSYIDNNFIDMIIRYKLNIVTSSGDQSLLTINKSAELFTEINNMLELNGVFAIPKGAKIYQYLDKYIHPYFDKIYSQMIEFMYKEYINYQRYILNNAKHQNVLTALMTQVCNI